MFIVRRKSLDMPNFLFLRRSRGVSWFGTCSSWLTGIHWSRTMNWTSNCWWLPCWRTCPVEIPVLLGRLL